MHVLLVITGQGSFCIIIAWPTCTGPHLYQRDTKNARFDMVFNLFTYPCDELQLMRDTIIIMVRGTVSHLLCEGFLCNLIAIE